MHQWKQRFLFIVGVIALATIFHVGLTERLPDADSLYHIRHAWLYSTEGIASRAFPWAQFSVIQSYSADIWYGFHLLLLPFARISDIGWGLEFAGIFLTSCVLITFGLILERQRVRLPYLWPFVLFFIIPNVLFYLLMVRPHLLSLTAGLLLLFALCERKAKIALLASGAITFFHLSYFWFALFIIAAYMSVQYTTRARWWHSKNEPPAIPWGVVGLACIGIFVGAIARPGPVGGMALAYIQIVQLFFEKMRGIPLIFGIELSPMSIGDLFRTSLLFFALWIASILIVFRNITTYRKREPSPYLGSFVGTSALLSSAFFLLTMLVAIRFFLPWVAFGTIVIAYAYSLLRENREMRTGVVYIVLAFIIMVPFALWRHSLNVRYVARDPQLFAEASGWLRSNTSPGDTVFHLHWDEFSELFFYDQRNYFINGMDPIFQYAYNPELYWKFHYLSIDVVSDKTCGLYPCRESQLVDTYEVLTRDFKAKYVFIEPERNPNVLTYLNSDPRYERVYEDNAAIIFAVKK